MPESDADERIATRFDELLSGINHAQTSTTKYRQFEEFLGQLLKIAPDTIYTSHIFRSSNFDVRMTQSRRARDASFRVALVPNTEDLQPVITQSRRLTIERYPGSAILVVFKSPSGWRPYWGIQPGTEDAQTTGDMSRLVQVTNFNLEDYRYVRQEPEGATPLAQAQAIESHLNPVTTIPPIVDPRIRRMLRNAIASSRAVMLVGPPGTGKSTLVEEIARECSINPSAYGMKYPHELSIVTPDESWTTRDLVGGTTVDSAGQLKFAPGHVLQAVRADRWLLLDEANRADLDKIFGGLLTWLSGQQVTVGRESPGSSTEIVLSWTDSYRSGVDGTETVYSAGKEWRLFGTYNSLDAHRVFRLGLALGRRFAQIPVPPPSPEMFRDIVRERLQGDLEGVIGDQVADVVARIYEIHAASEAVALGPALFLSILKYVSAGLQINPLNLGKALEPNSTAELIAEAYLSGFGTWLARLDDEVLDSLGTNLRLDNALGSQWDWVREQLPNLA